MAEFGRSIVNQAAGVGTSSPALWVSPDFPVHRPIDCVVVTVDCGRVIKRVVPVLAVTRKTTRSRNLLFDYEPGRID